MVKMMADYDGNDDYLDVDACDGDGHDVDVFFDDENDVNHHYVVVDVNDENDDDDGY